MTEPTISMDSPPPASMDGEVASADTLAITRQERGRKARLTVIASNVFRVMRVVLTFLSAPIALGHFGAARYGLWRSTASVISFLGLLDLGMGSSLVNAMADARGRGQQAELGRLFASLVIPAVGLFTGMGMLLCLAINLVPISLLLGPGSAELYGEARMLLFVVVWLSVLRLFLQIVRAAQQSFQEDFVTDAWGTAGALMGFLGLLGVVAAGAGLVRWAQVLLGVDALIGLLNLGQFLHAHPECFPSLGRVHRDRFLMLLGGGVPFLALGVSTVLVLQSDNLVISQALGTAAVVPYAVAFSVVMTIITGIHSLSGSLWSAYAEAAGRGDWSWIAKTYRRVTTMSCWWAALAAIGCGLWLPDFVGLWLGQTVRVSPGLAAALGAYVLVNIWFTAPSVVLASVGRVKAQLVVTWLDGLSNLALSIWLVRHWGILGVALGTLLPGLLVSSWAIPWLLWHTTQGRMSAPLIPVLREIGLPGIVAAAAGFALRRSMTSLPCAVRLVVGGCSTVALFTLATLAGSTSARAQVRRRVESWRGGRQRQGRS